MNKIQDKKLELIMEEILIQEVVINNPFKNLSWGGLKEKFLDFAQLKKLNSFFKKFTLNSAILAKPQYQKLYKEIVKQPEQEKIEIIRDYVDIIAKAASHITGKIIEIKVTTERIRKDFIKSNNINSAFVFINSLLNSLSKKTNNDVIKKLVTLNTSYEFSQKDFDIYFESVNNRLLKKYIINESDISDEETSIIEPVAEPSPKSPKIETKKESKIPSINELKTTVIENKNAFAIIITAILGIIIAFFAITAQSKKMATLDAEGLPGDSGKLAPAPVEDTVTDSGGLTVTSSDDETDDTSDSDDSQSVKKELQKEKQLKEKEIKQLQGKKADFEKEKNKQLTDKDSTNKELKEKQDAFFSSFLNSKEIKQLETKLEKIDKTINTIENKISDNESKINSLNGEIEELQSEIETLSDFESLKLDNMQKNINEMGQKGTLSSLNQLQIKTNMELKQTLEDVKTILENYKTDITTNLEGFDDLDGDQQKDILKSSFEKDKTVGQEIKKDYFEKLQKIKSLQKDISAIGNYSPSDFDSKQFSLSEHAKALDSDNSDNYKIDYKVKDGKVSLDNADLKKLSDNVKEFQKTSVDFKDIKEKVESVKDYVKKASELEKKIADTQDDIKKDELKQQLKELNQKMKTDLPGLAKIMSDKGLSVSDLASNLLLNETHSSSGFNVLLSDTGKLIKDFEGTGEYKWEKSNYNDFFNKIIKGQGVSPAEVKTAFLKNPELVKDFNGEYPDSSKGGNSIWTKGADGKFKIDEVNAKKFADAVKKLNPVEIKNETKTDNKITNTKIPSPSEYEAKKLQKLANDTSKLIESEKVGKWNQEDGKNFFKEVIQKYQLDPMKVKDVLDKNPELRKDFNGVSADSSKGGNSIWTKGADGKFKIDEGNAQKFADAVKAEINRIDTDNQMTQDAKIIGKFNSLNPQQKELIKSQITASKGDKAQINSGKGHDWTSKSLQDKKDIIGKAMGLNSTEVDRLIDNSKQLIQYEEKRKDVKDLFTILESNYFKR
jgi:hypothetical protein